MTTTTHVPNGGRKLLDYLEDLKNSNLDGHVYVFQQTIKVNGGTNKSTKIAHFQWTLWDSVLVWGNNFMNKDPISLSLKELELN